MAVASARQLGGRLLSKHIKCSAPCRTLILEATPPKQHVIMQKLQGSDAGMIEVVLNRPESRNAIGTTMLNQFQNVFESIHHDPAARVMILRSDVPGVFCAGADLKERRKMDIPEVQKYSRTIRSTFSYLEALSIPTIAVIEGAALGGGLELALACDLRVCGSGAILGLPETSLAIIPGAGGTQRLPRLIGEARAKELIFTARKFDAKYAEKIGLVEHCVESGAAHVKAIEIAREIMKQGPLAVRMAKVAIDRGIEMETASGMVLEEACYAQTLHTKDRLEALDAFAEKRKPQFCGE
ncbi:hypothetical protein GOP47_0001000 [Adiantum capillus-veneris]|uniref:Methylglutaconyl-CoA hydratase n=2 Tax=Adiantum capillus-veneris TaxID=13818 RepID=A0A9D4VFT0_ADICA|nr:hypothetical protein GOP47_0001000 [Adiantum capillus-veneris]